MSNDINDYFKITGNDIVIKVKIVPGSSKNKILGVHNDAIKITITAPPIEGKANKKCIAYLAKYFDVAKSKIEIISGQTSKNKLIKIYDISQKEFLDKIEKIS
ncbi:YggU family protein [bacterium]|nr:YggU family protein [Candidatus Atribacteria bacterium]MBU1035585.1 YggU family protein [bacterium]MBU1291093.1 YggU family protein [bacterium]MBU1428176.1 YggU family protein [bacterium]MBU2440181.1 YggU family protein [bacterium]